MLLTLAIPGYSHNQFLFCVIFFLSFICCIASFSIISFFQLNYKCRSTLVVQIQYKIRITSSHLHLSNYPDSLLALRYTNVMIHSSEFSSLYFIAGMFILCVASIKFLIMSVSLLIVALSILFDISLFHHDSSKIHTPS